MYYFYLLKTRFIKIIHFNHYKKHNKPFNLEELFVITTEDSIISHFDKKVKCAMQHIKSTNNIIQLKIWHSVPLLKTRFYHTSIEP